jgi:hypothetical protein
MRISFPKPGFHRSQWRITGEDAMRPFQNGDALFSWNDGFQKPVEERQGAQVFINDDTVPNVVVGDNSPEGTSQEGQVEGGEIIETPTPCHPRF